MPQHNPRNYENAPVEVHGDSKSVPMTAIRPNPWNYNKQDEKTFNKLVASMRRFGFVSPVIVRQHPKLKGTYEVINGEHRFNAARVLGMTSVPIVDLGKVDDDKAKQLSIILNELSGSPDQVRLADLLRDISDTVPIEDLQVVMPYTERELKMFMEAVDFSFDSLSGADPRSQEEQDAQAAQSRAAEANGKEAAPAPQGEAEAETEVVGRLVFSLEPDQAERVHEALAAIDADPNVALLALVDQYLGDQQETEDDEPAAKEASA